MVHRKLTDDNTKTIPANMLLPFVCLLISAHLVVGNPHSFTILGYDIIHENNVLKSVRNTSNSADYLDLSDHGFVEIDKNAFKGLTDLKSLILDNNHLPSLPVSVFSDLIHLDYLSLSHNRLTNMNFMIGLSTSLKILYLNNNTIVELPPGTFVKLNKLEHLDLDHNNVTSLTKGTFNGLSSIKLLRIGYNKLTKIFSDSFHGLPDTLITLGLNGNQIKILNSGTFLNIPRDVLDLSDNKIIEIKNGSFKQPKLKYLYLSHNLLATLTPDSFMGLSNLKYLFLISNRISVISDDQQEQLKNYLNENVTVFYDGNPFMQSYNKNLILP